MSNFFAGVDDSDSDESYEEQQQVVQEEDNQWFESDSDDENAAYRRTTKTERTEKLKNDVQDANDQLDMLIDSDYKQAMDQFNEVVTKSRAYLKNETQAPEGLLQTIIRVREHINDVLDGKEAQELEAEDFCDGQDIATFRTFRRQNGQLEKEFKDQLEKYEKGEIDAEPTEGESTEAPAVQQEDWSEEGLIAMLARLPSEHKVKVVIDGVEKQLTKAKVCTKIIQEAAQQSLPHVQLAALCLQATFIVEDASGTHLHIATWRSAFDALSTAFSLCQKHPLIVIAEQDSLEKITAKRTIVNGGFTVVAQQLFRELQRSFQFSSGHDAELIKRVKDEHSLLVLLDQLLGYYIERGSKRQISRCASLLFEMISPRSNNAAGSMQAVDDLASSTLFQRSASTSASSCTRFLHELIMKNTSEPYVQARATLLLAYNLAVTGAYQAGCDLILQTKLHEASQAAPDTLCVLFNRVLAQLGLCAFRMGKFVECNNLLGDICSRPPREIVALLGQDIIKDYRQQYSAEKELADRERLVPPHHAISMKLLEAASLVSAMFVGLVSEAKKPNAPTNRARHFQKLINQQNYALITGGPADHKEAIYVAYQALQKSNFTEAIDTVKKMEIWSKLPDRCGVLSVLENKMKEDSLKVFLVSHGCNFASLTVDHLSRKFDLSVKEVRSYVSQLLLERDSSIVGFWDHAESCLTIERGNPSKLHHLIEQSVERLSYLPVGAQSTSFKMKGKGMRARTNKFR